MTSRYQLSSIIIKNELCLIDLNISHNNNSHTIFIKKIKNSWVNSTYTTRHKQTPIPCLSSYCKPLEVLSMATPMAKRSSLISVILATDLKWPIKPIKTNSLKRRYKPSNGFDHKELIWKNWVYRCNRWKKKKKELFTLKRNIKKIGSKTILWILFWRSYLLSSLVFNVKRNLHLPP